VQIEFDVTEIMRPGVYLLRLGPVVVYIGKAKCLLVGLGMHMAIRNRPALPAWFPIPRVAFDRIAIIPCGDPAKLHTLHAALVELHRPVHTRSDLRTPEPTLTAPSPALVRRNLETSPCPSL
jgi:hypothetical protein